MTFYIVIALIIVFLCKEVENTKKSRRNQAIIGAVILIFFSACRSIETGSDSSAYIRTFDLVAGYSWIQILLSPISMEKGFLCFCKLLSFVSTDEHWLFLWSSLISIIPFAIFVSKYCYKPAYAWVIYILSHQFSFEMCIMRQSMAMGICLGALCLLWENKKHKTRRFFFAMLLIGVAYLFHRSALLFAIFALIAKQKSKYDVKDYTFLIMCIGVLIALSGRISQLMVSKELVPKEAVLQTSGTGIGRLFIPVCILIAFLLFKNVMYAKDENSNLWELGCFFPLILSVSSYWILPFARASLYYQILNCVMLPNLIQVQPSKGNRIIMKVVILILFSVYFVLNYDAGNFYKYVFWK